MFSSRRKVVSLETTGSKGHVISIREIKRVINMAILRDYP